MMPLSSYVHAQVYFHDNFIKDIPSILDYSFATMDLNLYHTWADDFIVLLCYSAHIYVFSQFF
jgi:hypothetical protein